MRDKYPYLRDPRALAEIRKHKWIESQKLGEEIGFATAAVDWIKKYGQEWKEIHLEENRDDGIFLERRRYRRFKLDCIIELIIKNNNRLLAELVNISFFGVTCRTAEPLEAGSEVNVRLLNQEENLICKGVLERLFPLNSNKYELFIKFNDCSQKELQNWSYIRRSYTAM